MNDKDSSQRRLLLKALGTTAILPLASTLGACSGEKTETPNAAPKPAVEQKPAPKVEAMAEEVVQEVTEEVAEEAAEVEQVVEESSAAAEEVQLTPLAEDDAQAKALAYVEDATTTDTSVQVRYESGQECSNCVLFMPQGDAGRGACSIFPGRSVNSGGWCSVYAPKA